jgi:predicted HicB family RNase H-like nuclease
MVDKMGIDIKCKRIIDGKTYNTETATQIEGWSEDHDEPWPYESGVYLYQNRFGSFFLYMFRNGMGEEDYEEIEPYTPEQARSWLEKHRSYRVDLIESLFGAMPEAGSGEAKYTLRMPDSLRDRLAARAKANNQSLNAWIVRCLESCAAEPAFEADSDIPQMTGVVGSNRVGWRTKGT